MAVPNTPSLSREALAKGDTLVSAAVHPLGRAVAGGAGSRPQRRRPAGGSWPSSSPRARSRSPRLEPARERTLVLLGHEWHGVPEEKVELADTCVEIPMVGLGASLNVAVAGSLVLYRLAGLV